MINKTIEHIVAISFIAVGTAAVVGFIALYGKFVEWLLTVNRYLGLFAGLLLLVAYLYIFGLLIIKAVEDLYK